MITSRLTAKSQTTVPQPVRKALNLKPGDELVYRIEDDRVVLTRADEIRHDPFATFSEWDSEADRRGYRDL